MIKLFLIIASVAALTATANAQGCAEWKPVPTDLSQSNNTSLYMGEPIKIITAKSSYTAPTMIYAKMANQGTKGQADIIIDGTSVKMKIYWGNRQVGIYDGTITLTGRVEGTGYERNSPNTIVTWFTGTQFECIRNVSNAPKPGTVVLAPTPAPKPTGPTGPPIKTTGKAKADEPVTGPTIKASPAYGTVPAGQTSTQTTIRWDAGPGINYAELFVQIDNGPEKYLEGGIKGTREVNIEPGKKYVFFIKYSKKRIASTNVIFSQK